MRSNVTCILSHLFLGFILRFPRSSIAESGEKNSRVPKAITKKVIPKECRDTSGIAKKMNIRPDINGE